MYPVFDWNNIRNKQQTKMAGILWSKVWQQSRCLWIILLVSYCILLCLKRSPRSIMCFVAIPIWCLGITKSMIQSVYSLYRFRSGQREHSKNYLHSASFCNGAFSYRSVFAISLWNYVPDAGTTKLWPQGQLNEMEEHWQIYHMNPERIVIIIERNKKRQTRMYTPILWERL